MRQLAAFLLLLITSSVCAQEVRVDAVLADDRPFVGTPVRYTIVVTGSQSAGMPDLPEIPLLRSSFQTTTRESSFQSRIVNGQRERSLVERLLIHYEIIADAPGAHTIPPVELQVGGRAFTTEPVSFVAVMPRVNRDSVVLFESERSEVFVGQPVPIRLIWYTDGARLASARGPMAQDRVDLYAPARPRWRSEDGAQSINIRFMDQDIAAGLVENAVRDGVVHDLKITLDLILIATEPGRLELGPITIEYQQFSSRRFDRRAPQREFARSDSLWLDVLPLPQENVPESFDGLVGVASLSAQASSQSVKAGDPIELTLTVLAEEPIERIDPPDLANQASDWSAFQLDPNGWQERTTTSTTRTFTTTIRARDASVMAIPAIELAFFDPNTKHYASASTRRIPLSVRAVQTITSADVLGALPETGPPEAISLRELHAGVLDNATGPALLIDESASVLGLLRSPAGLGVIVAPPLAFALSGLVLMARRRVHSPAHRRGRALARARAALSGDGSQADRVRTAIRLYVGERFAREEQTITPKDCRDLLACGEDDEVSGQIASLLTQAERGRFDDAPDPAPPPVDRVGELLGRADSIEPGESP